MSPCTDIWHPKIRVARVHSLEVPGCLSATGTQPRACLRYCMGCIQICLLSCTASS
ncbi:hypothetical protein T440DRAFT_465859 [Plenodomus tracheiphilus IPT5]|uniref:Uncharacterized protein n=1 Tax=Plenodomus tracheiphilus IPT5 TaxID=1408161 RepID=A0A6A7BG51_9PLEO|nr:hypothetical protein T440DRAFT_465859 [Plenodomus tracheiphilus IPT5]